MLNIDRDDVINKISAEILEEVKNSKQSFTKEEIKEKINSKLNQFFANSNKDHNERQSKKLDEDEEFIKSQFSNIDEISDQEEDKNDDLTNSLSAFEEIDGEERVEETKEKIEEESGNEEFEPENKKKFFQEISKIYQDELKNSLDCFRSAWEACKLMKKTSIIEKIAILLVLVIPAAVGGIFTFAFILMLFLLWQLHILLKVCLRYFNNLEKKVKETISTIKKKIKSIKSSGGFFNRLIFANSLYSLIMFNGILYMLIKGMIVPLKSAMEIDKIVANIMSRGVRAVTIGLRTPSELALNRLNANAIKSNKVSGKEKGLGRNKLQLKGLLLAKRNLLNKNKDMGKKAEATKIAIVKDKIAANIFTKLEAIEKNLAEQKLNALGEKIETIKNPIGIKLSNDEKKPVSRNDLSSMILHNVLDNLENRAIEQSENSLKNPITPEDSDNKASGRLSSLASSELRRAVDNDINGDNKSNTSDNNQSDYNSKDSNSNEKSYGGEKTEKKEQAEKAIAIQEEIVGSKENRDKIERFYNNGDGGMPIAEAIKMSGVEMSHDEQLKYAFNKAAENVGRHDEKQTYEFEQYPDKHPNATPADYFRYKVDSAQGDMDTELEDFAKYYDGRDCKTIFANAMKECGYDKSKQLTDEQVYEVAKHAVEDPKNGFSEEQQVNAMKDLRKYNLTYRELQTCKQELNAEIEKTQSRHVDNLSKSKSEQYSDGRGF